MNEPLLINEPTIRSTETLLPSTSSSVTLADEAHDDESPQANHRRSARPAVDLIDAFTTTVDQLDVASNTNIAARLFD